MTSSFTGSIDSCTLLLCINGSTKSIISKFIITSPNQFRNHNLTLVATLYSHPLDFAFTNSLPMIIGLLILKSRMHIVTFSSWALFRLLWASEEHCGYNFPWNLNKCVHFGVSKHHHTYHHEKNIGNYSGCFKFWDRVFGTDYTFLVNQSASVVQPVSKFKLKRN